MKTWSNSLWTCVVAVSVWTPATRATSQTQEMVTQRRALNCDVIIIGGSTAALAAALAAAQEFTWHGGKRRACLAEPTDWPGGQLTSSGVPAVDFAHHKASLPDGTQQDTGAINRHRRTHAAVFGEWMRNLGGMTGELFSFPKPPVCSVSVRCFEPSRLLGSRHQPGTIFASLGRFDSNFGGNGSLFTLFNTVIKKVVKDDKGRITAVELIKRTPTHQQRSLDKSYLSQSLEDWYSPKNSRAYKKEIVTLRLSGNVSARFPVVIDASEWGEVLALSGASYLQGIENQEANPLAGSQEMCGQTFVFPMALDLRRDTIPLESVEPWVAVEREFQAYRRQLVKSGAIAKAEDLYSIAEPNKPFTFDFVWVYRRVRLGPIEQSAQVSQFFPGPQIGDTSIQNWSLGNDYPFRYLFHSRAKTKASVQSGDWKGGVDMQALREAELHALGWFVHLRANGRSPWNDGFDFIGDQIAPSPILGTKTGLAKVPYVRDTRRSVGVDNFVLSYKRDLLSGKTFPDAVATGSYSADIHPTLNRTPNTSCKMPAEVVFAPTNPPIFQLPFVAHTNKDVDNLLVAGKTIAQTFLASAATRSHPLEFASGTAAGVAAAMMAMWQSGSREVIAEKKVSVIRERVTKHQPTHVRPEVLPFP